jgi:hypothetical protein
MSEIPRQLATRDRVMQKRCAERTPAERLAAMMRLQATARE